MLFKKNRYLTFILSLFAKQLISAEYREQKSAGCIESELDSHNWTELTILNKNIRQ